MSKQDFKKLEKEYYQPTAKHPVIVTIPEFQFLMIDGEGDPNTSQSFQDAIEALYSVSYKIKFLVKKQDENKDYVVLPLEGLWWADDMSDFDLANKAKWKWTLMIRQPEFINHELVEEARAEVKKKKNPKALPELRFESYNEGKSIQIMYIGPFIDEGPVIRQLHDQIEESGSAPNGKHHEIYLSDFRKVKPEKLKTVIRQPMK